MDVILFSGAGLAMILFSFFLKKKHKKFMATSIEVPGKIIDIVERLHVTRNVTGGIARQRSFKVPVVEYRYNKSYQFESDKDITQDGLKVGSSVTVRIDPLHPKVAKLAISLASNFMLFYLMIGLGIFLIGIGVVQYKPSDFDLSLFDDWLTLGFILVGGIYLYVKLSPLVSLLKYNPIYTENAKEVEVSHEDST